MTKVLAVPLLLLVGLLAACAADLGGHAQFGPEIGFRSAPFYDGGVYEPPPFAVDEIRP